MNDYCTEALKKMYDISMEKMGAKDVPLLVKIVSSNKNTVKRALSQASEIHVASSSVMELLCKEGYIRQISPGKYSITAKGILYIEFDTFPVDRSKYTKWLDDKYLEMDNAPITDKNRVILLSVFAARCFSEDTAASYSDESREDAFLQLLKDSFDFLCSINVIEPHSLDLDRSIKSKSQMSSILNQIEKLPQSTGMKFIASGKKEYYLDVLKDGGIDRPSITFLTKIILGENITRDCVKKLEDFCDIHYHEYAYIFKTGKTSFDDAITRFQLKNAMEDAAQH